MLRRGDILRASVCGVLPSDCDCRVLRSDSVLESFSGVDCLECGRALFLHHDTSSVGAISRSRRTLNPHDATIGRALFHDVDTNSTCAGADVLSESRDVVGTIIKTAHSCGGPSNEDKKK